MKTKRGDVVLVLFPDSNRQTSKRRPALVVQADNLLTGLPQTVLAMISSNLARAGHASRVTIYLNSPEGTRSGLRTDSIVMTDKLATVLDSEIVRVLGSLAGLPSVDTALRHTLGL